MAATLLAAAGASLRAQTQPTDASTIHVYTNLLQIPVLILGPHREPLPPIAARDFSVRLGDYPAFRPRTVRLQGDDPITLAVLVDGSARNTLLASVPESLPAAVREHLRDHDRIVVYGMDGCHLWRFGTLGPPEAEHVRNAATEAVSHPPYDPYRRHAEHCSAPVGLWDAMSYVATSLAAEPGRRVLLAISNGVDDGSQTSVEIVRQTATHAGVAIFSIAENDKVALGRGISTGVFTATRGPSPLTVVSDGSGGMILETGRKELPGTLKRFIDLLRGRYIVEFSRPPGISAGTHMMVISCGLPRAFIRSAGTSLPVSDPIAADPTVQHGASDPSAGVLPTPN